MPYRELIMVDIKEMLRRRAAGQSARHVARETGFDRKTVGRYFEAAATLPLPPDREPTDEEIHAIAQRVQARPVPDASEEWKEIGAHRARIEAWLAQPRPLKLTKIHTLLKRDHGVSASYDTLRRFAMEELAWRKKTPTVRVADTEPGEVAQIDFGLMGKLFDPATQRVRNLWVLVVTLAYSRYQFVWPSFEQTTAAVCAGLDAAWKFFGAMARVILPDNMKAIVLRADELAPVLVPAFLDYAQTRGLLVDAARVRSPKDKARVENQVAYVRESWFDGESFVGIYAERLLDVPLPWTRMRLVYALLRLCNKFGNGRVEAICQSALAFDVVDVQRVTRMLEAAKTPASPPTDERKVVTLPTPRFARSTEHFATRTLAAAAMKEEA